jgi:uncharacterized protein
MNNIFWILAGSLMFTTADGASFDCGKAKSKIEKLICDKADLSALDDELNKSYQNALDKTRLGDNQQVILAQKRWLKLKRNACSDEPCLREVYSSRIQELNEIYPFFGTYFGSSRACEGSTVSFTPEGISLDGCKNIPYDITESDKNHVTIKLHKSPNCNTSDVNLSRAIPLGTKTLKPIKGFGNVVINECMYGPEYSAKQHIMINSGTY